MISVIAGLNLHLLEEKSAEHACNLPSWCPVLVDSGLFLLPWKPQLTVESMLRGWAKTRSAGHFTTPHQYHVSIHKLRPRFLFVYHHFCASWYGILWGQVIEDKWPSSDLSEKSEAHSGAGERGSNTSRSHEGAGLLMGEAAASSYVAMCSTA